MTTVQVLLSAYNGSKYISEQIESILNQSYHTIKILVRDDGSTDETTDILQYYRKRYPSKIQYIEGKNIGIVNSFLELLKHADPTSDYFCFCDQDDIWLPDKVERAIKLLHSFRSIPAMVCTTTMITDESLRTIGIWPKPPLREPSFFNAMIQNIAVGATITINQQAWKLITGKPVCSENILMHDWWTYLCVSAFGKVFFDPEPSILYRQHGNNAIGGTPSFLELLTHKWKSYKRHKGKRLLHKQASEFYRVYGDLLDEEKKSELLFFLKERETFRDRLTYLSKCKVYRNSPFEHFLFKFLIWIGYV